MNEPAGIESEGPWEEGQVVHLTAEGVFSEEVIEVGFLSLPAHVQEAVLDHAANMQAERTGTPVDFAEDSEPQFVIVGVQRPGGIILFASMDVTDTKFARRAEGFDRIPITDNPHGPVARVPRTTAVVAVKMNSFEQILGEDYPSALRTLLEHWRRKTEARDRVALPELPPGG